MWPALLQYSSYKGGSGTEPAGPLRMSAESISRVFCSYKYCFDHCRIVLLDPKTRLWEGKSLGCASSSAQRNCSPGPLYWPAGGWGWVVSHQQPLKLHLGITSSVLRAEGFFGVCLFLCLQIFNPRDWKTRHCFFTSLDTIPCELVFPSLCFSREVSIFLLRFMMF